MLKCLGLILIKTKLRLLSKGVESSKRKKKRELSVVVIIVAEISMSV